MKTKTRIRSNYWFQCEDCEGHFVQIGHPHHWLAEPGAENALKQLDPTGEHPDRTHCGRCLEKHVGRPIARIIGKANVERGRKRAVTYAEGSARAYNAEFDKEIEKITPARKRFFDSGAGSEAGKKIKNGFDLVALGGDA